MNSEIVTGVAAGLELLGLIGAGYALVRARSRTNELERELVRAEERARALEGSQAANAQLLKAQASETAAAVAEQLVTRASETFRAQDQLAQAKLEAQLKPVAETLAKFEAQVQAIEKSRAEDTGGLKTQIEALLKASDATQSEARKLSAALRRGAGVQGRWGEQTLRNVLEMAGLTNRFDFDEQVSTDTEEGRRRPDVTVRLPSGGVLVIDAKVSLNAFLESQECPDEATREACLARHVTSVREHMKALAAKAYWDQFDSSPDVVAMFVPGDGFLAAALDRQPELMAEAMERKVVIVTPTTLFALCKAVAYGWRAEDQAKGAAKVAELGRELYKRIAVMGEHVSGLGRALEGAVGKYNAFLASLETQVITQAKKFEELASHHEGKAIPELKQVETGVRATAKLAAVAQDEDAAA
jgi:DNA recombination protein RmuC